MDDNSCIPPSAADVARRLQILKFFVVHAWSNPPRNMLDQMFARWDKAETQNYIEDRRAADEKHWQRVHDAGLWSHLSPEEKRYAETSAELLDSQDQYAMVWQLEAAQVLIWALSHIESLPAYDLQASLELFKSIPSDNITGFVESSRLRPHHEIERARDIAELWHWRSRTREIIEEGEQLVAIDELVSAGFRTYDDIVRFTASRAAEDGTIPNAIDDDFPARGKAYRDLLPEEWSEVHSITFERHFALNWLCGFAPDNRWEDTPTDT
jgi:hypothetical protein